MIAGGGLSGLTETVNLARQGVKAPAIEKKRAPVSQVGGEYVRNEAFPFSIRQDFFPDKLTGFRIKKLQISGMATGIPGVGADPCLRTVTEFRRCDTPVRM